MSMDVIFFLWLFCILLGMPVFAALGLASMLHVFSNELNFFIIPQRLTTSADSFPLLAAPFFILMGNIMNSAGVTRRIFNFANTLVGWMRGGLGHAHVVAAVIFAGMSGSAVADAGGLGTLEIAAMREAGYDDDFTCAITAASSTIGPIIPPSLPMVIYGVLAETSVGGLFIGGIVPGLLMAAALMLMVRFYATRHNYPRERFPGLFDIWRSFVDAFWALLTPALLLGGILTGAFTPTESAVFAAFFALFLGLFIYRELNWRDLPRTILGTTETNGVVLALVMTAVLFSWNLSVDQVPQRLGAYLSSISDSPLAVLFIINVFLLFVGCFMEATAAQMILVPILFPVAQSLGIPSIQFGIIVVLNLMIGTITPPIGVVLFVVANVAKIPFERVTRATIPFIIPLAAVLILITVFPPLTTYLPWILMGVR
ncbi:MAG: TRAP transporter large permease [Planctomycetota bacterium]|jgi:tripartite ATP-independent transporter DctM subunit|nr:TRAP transporter large permease [Planctomycetota bacterium]